MVVPPSGIVTFLFTDIEGSTRLWERDPAAMRLVAARHDNVLSDIVARHGGLLYKHVGDAIQAAFPEPEAAVFAATEAQRAFAAGIGTPDRLLVRMAIHLGEAAPNANGDYNQVACLNRLSRLLSTGYGGQVLLSDAVRRGVADRLPPGVTLKDLGRHRLRDLLEPERVAQLAIEGLADQFPPLKSLERYPTNIGRQPTSLIGRADELAALYDLLADPETRLVTIVGPGGVGKTRLAVQAGADLLDLFEDGVWLVELGALDDPALVLPAIADVLGVREGGGQSLPDRLADYLESRTALLILDNIEHLLDAGPDLADLLDACPDLTVVTTSRAPLDLRAERVFPLAPLTPPAATGGRRTTLADLAANDAAALFLARVRAKSPRFAATDEDAATIAAICRRLDGLPLALELAAAQTVGLSLAEVLAELDRRFDLLVGGARDLLPHQRALETTIAWSYDRLDPVDQAAFRRLSVFAGGFSREAAEAVVAAADPAPRSLPRTLVTLVANSMVRRPPGDAAARYDLLESLRAFGRGRLEAAGEAAPVRAAHAAVFLALAREAAPHLTGAEQGAWLDRLATDHDNLRGALDWTVAAGDLPDAVGFVQTLWRFWNARGHLTEGRRRVEEVIRLGQDDPAALGAMPFVGAGTLASAHGDYAAATGWFERGLAAARDVHDQTTEIVALNNLGGVAMSLGDHRRAEALWEEALAVCEALDDRWRAAHMLANLASVANYLGDAARAEAGYRGALEVWEERQDRRRGAITLGNLALLLAQDRRRHDEARALGERALAESRALDVPVAISVALGALGIVAMSDGDLDLAARRHEEAIAVCNESEYRLGLATALGNLALVVAEAGEPARAAALAGESYALFLALGDQSGAATTLEILAQVAGAAGAWESAARFHGAADAALERIGQPLQAILRERRDARVAALRVGIGDAFDRAWDAGRELSAAALAAEIARLAADAAAGDAGRSVADAH